MATVPFIPVREVIVYCPNSGIWNAMTPALKQRYFLCYWSDERIIRLGMIVVAWMLLAGIFNPPSSRAAEQPSVRVDYKHPTFAMPYAQTPPTIDGIVNALEWRQALRVGALQTPGGTMSIRQTTFYLCWDEQHIYVAMQSPLRKGERPIQRLRQRDIERNVVFDDSYEVFVNAGTRTEDGQPCFFQFLSNFSGARYDVLHLPAVGNSRINWSSGWEPVNRLTEDNVWEWEMAIPRSSLFLTEPLREGMTISMLLARNYKRPWEQNSVEGTSSFSVPDTHSRYTLSKAAPAVHLLSQTDIANKKLVIGLGGWASADQSIKWSYESDGGAVESGTLALPTATQHQFQLDATGNGAFRIRATSADGKKTYLDWSSRLMMHPLEMEPVLNDPGDVVRLGLNLNPINDYLRIAGDFIEYDARAQFHSFRAVVTDEAGQEVASSNYAMDALAYVAGVLALPQLQPGQYNARLDCLDAEGKVALSIKDTFEKKDHAQAFPWWKTEHGNIERVISPWTPVAAQPDKVAVWGREMEIGEAGLPSQVTSQGRPLLSSPVRLELDGEDGGALVAQGTTTTLISSHEHRARYVARSQLGPLTLESLITVEFDGMYRVDLNISAPQASRVAGLRMVVPLDQRTVDYYHGAGRGIRYGFDFGRIPHGPGRVWDSRKVGGNPMKIGSFVPYIMMTGTEAGLCWFADNDQGWTPNDDVPAFEIRRDDHGNIDLVFNFISSDTLIDQLRTISFAFQATPNKKMHADWRRDGWWCGDTFYDFQGVEKKGGSLIWTNIPFTLDAEACRKVVDARRKGTNRYNYGVDMPMFSVPYLEWKHIASQYAPEVKYFGDQWTTTISDGLAFEETLTDYLVYHIYTWAKTCGIDGVYIDNNRPQACALIDAGRGYRLPDGRVQPTYNLFAVRRLFLRMRAALQEGTGRSNTKFVLHTTNNLIAPWLGAADIAFDGEHHVIYPEAGKTFMDYWTPERLRLSFSGALGTPVNFMHEYQGPWDDAAVAQAMRSYSGACILFDMLPGGNANGLNTPLWIGRERFGIADPGVTFIGPWRNDAGLRCEQDNIHLAAWTANRRVLIAVVNYGEATTAKLQLDGSRLGLGDPAGWTIEDAEADTTITRYVPQTRSQRIIWDSAQEASIQVDADGLISVPVKRHNYRQIIIRSR